MTTAATSLLGLALPVTGELSGTWGDTVNNSITSLLDTAVAGTTTLSTDADVTLTTTTLASNQARQAILLCSGARTALRTITAPAQSKIYTIINATTGGYSVKLVGVGPTTGLTIPNGASAVVAWNGSDFIEVGSATVGNLTVNGNLSVTGTTSLTGVATLTANPVLSAGTANGVAYLNGSKVLTTGSALTFDGNRLTVSSTTPSIRIDDTNATGPFGVDWYFSGAGGITRANISLDGSTGEMQFQSGASGSSGWFQTFVISGSEGMRLTSTGLGIGTSSPAARLDVVNNSTYQLRVASSTGNYADGGIYLGSLGTSDPYYYSAIRYVQSTETLNIQNSSASAGKGGISFLIGRGNPGTPSQVALIDTSGNLGLGVTPSAWGTLKALQIVGAGFSGTANNAYVSANTYYDGTNWKYINSDYATYYTQQGGKHIWNNAASGGSGTNITFTQAMTLDASGNLGIGTTSPTDSSTFGRALDVQGTGGAAAYFRASGTSPSTDYFAVGYSPTAAYLYNRANSPMLFYTNGSERARITSGGYFKASNSGGYVGSTGTYHELRSDTANEYVVRITQSSASPAAACPALFSFTASAPNDTSAWFIDCTDNTARRAYIRSNGGFSNYQANDTNLSDRHEKINFAPAKSYLDVICAIPVQTFNYIDQSEEDPGLTLGVVAQDVQAVAPELVMESNWAKEGDEPKMRLSIYQTDLQYALMKCIQEQQAIIETLTARITALEAK